MPREREYWKRRADGLCVECASVSLSTVRCGRCMDKRMAARAGRSGSQISDTLEGRNLRQSLRLDKYHWDKIGAERAKRAEERRAKREAKRIARIKAERAACGEERSPLKTIRWHEPYHGDGLEAYTRLKRYRPKVRGRQRRLLCLGRLVSELGPNAWRFAVEDLGPFYAARYEARCDGTIIGGYISADACRQAVARWATAAPAAPGAAPDVTEVTA